MVVHRWFQVRVGLGCIWDAFSVRFRVGFRGGFKVSSKCV